MQLPPFKSLRAFESAARNLSISKAAEELFVTPGAISQQIKLLEAHLEIQLFRRLHRRILLTDAGQGLYRGVQQGLASIDKAIRDVESISQNRPLVITTPPSFAIKWLPFQWALLVENPCSTLIIKRMSMRM